MEDRRRAQYKLGLYGKRGGLFGQILYDFRLGTIGERTDVNEKLMD